MTGRGAARRARVEGAVGAVAKLAGLAPDTNALDWIHSMCDGELLELERLAFRFEGWTRDRGMRVDGISASARRTLIEAWTRTLSPADGAAVARLGDRYRAFLSGDRDVDLDDDE